MLALMWLSPKGENFDSRTDAFIEANLLILSWSSEIESIGPGREIIEGWRKLMDVDLE